MSDSVGLNWFEWLLVGLFSVAAVSSTISVGKPREPTTGGLAAAIVVIDVLLIIGVITVGVGNG